MFTHYTTFKSDPEEADSDIRADVLHDLDELRQLISDGSINLQDIEMEFHGIEQRIDKALSWVDKI